jgi:carbamoyl-phosphate synthase large subunit
VTSYTTIAGALAAVEGMRSLKTLDVYSVQALHRQLTPGLEKSLA